VGGPPATGRAESRAFARVALSTSCSGRHTDGEGPTDTTCGPALKATDWTRCRECVWTPRARVPHPGIAAAELVAAPADRGRLRPRNPQHRSFSDGSPTRVRKTAARR